MSELQEDDDRLGKALDVAHLRRLWPYERPYRRSFGLALLMLLENVFPPIPSELIMPLAGFNAARGGTPLWLAILAGGLGSLAGAYMWYWVGRAFGRLRLRALIARHGRWLTLSVADVDRAQAWFDRHGAIAVLLGRLLPTIRTLISVPAGLAQMPFGRFLAWSAVGTFAWTTLLGLAGYLLEAGYARVEAWVNPVSTAIVAGIVAVYLWRVITWKGD